MASNRITVVFTCVLALAQICSAIPAPPMATMIIEGTIQKLSWHPERAVKGIPGLSGSAGHDRTIAAHYRLSLKETTVTSKGGGHVPFESGNAINIQLSHPKDDDYLKQGMKVKIIDFRMSGDEGGFQTSFKKIEVLNGKEAGPPNDAGEQAKGDAELKKIEVTVTPWDPYLLPDQSSKLWIKKETSWANRKRGGYPQLMHKDLILDIAPNTVIASGGYIFHLTTPHEYKFGNVRKSDMIFTVVDSCKSTVGIQKGKAPVVQLKGLSGILPFDCRHANQVSRLGIIRGAGKHFVSLTVKNSEIYKKHPSPVLGTGMDVIVVNNFGAKKIRLEYMQKQTVTIGPETITIESFNFDYPTKTVDVKVSTEPKVAEAEAFIVEYSNVKADTEPAGDKPAGDVEIKQDGKWKPAKLPLAGLAGGKAVEVKVRGKLRHGIMAIGGETTGTIISFGKTTWELDLRKNRALGMAAAKLNGKRVEVTGIVRQKAGVEIAKRTIVTVETMDPAQD